MQLICPIPTSLLKHLLSRSFRRFCLQCVPNICIRTEDMEACSKSHTLVCSMVFAHENSMAISRMHRRRKDLGTHYICTPLSSHCEELWNCRQIGKVGALQQMPRRGRERDFRHYEAHLAVGTTWESYLDN